MAALDDQFGIIKLTSVDGAALSSNVDLLFAMFHIEVQYLKGSKVRVQSVLLMLPGRV